MDIYFFNIIDNIESHFINEKKTELIKSFYSHTKEITLK